MSSVLSLDDYSIFRQEFSPVSQVDKSVGANIGKVWKELLSQNDETVQKVTGFVSRGSNIYALVGSTYNDEFNVIDWVSSRLSFKPKVPLTALNYKLVFGEGVLPRSIEEVLSEIRSVKSVNEPSSFNNLGVPTSSDTGTSYGDYSGGATSIISDDYISLSFNGESLDVFDEGEEYTVGRSSSSNLIVAIKGVSRSHLKVKYDEGVFQVYDLGSTNGTRVNGRKITPNAWTPVPDGSTLKIGRATLKVNKMED